MNLQTPILSVNDDVLTSVLDYLDVKSMAMLDSTSKDMRQRQAFALAWRIKSRKVKGTVPSFFNHRLKYIVAQRCSYFASQAEENCFRRPCLKRRRQEGCQTSQCCASFMSINSEILQNSSDYSYYVRLSTSIVGIQRLLFQSFLPSFKRANADTLECFSFDLEKIKPKLLSLMLDQAEDTTSLLLRDSFRLLSPWEEMTLTKLSVTVVAVPNKQLSTRPLLLFSNSGIQKSSWRYGDNERVERVYHFRRRYCRELSTGKDLWTTAFLVAKRDPENLSKMKFRLEFGMKELDPIENCQ